MFESCEIVYVNLGGLKDKVKIELEVYDLFVLSFQFRFDRSHEMRQHYLNFSILFRLLFLWVDLWCDSLNIFHVHIYMLTRNKRMSRICSDYKCFPVNCINWNATEIGSVSSRRSIKTDICIGMVLYFLQQILN